MLEVQIIQNINNTIGMGYTKYVVKRKKLFYIYVIYMPITKKIYCGHRE